MFVPANNHHNYRHTVFSMIPGSSRHSVSTLQHHKNASLCLSPATKHQACRALIQCLTQNSIIPRVCSVNKPADEPLEEPGRMWSVEPGLSSSMLLLTSLERLYKLVPIFKCSSSAPGRI